MRKLINDWLDDDDNVFKLNILLYNIFSKLSIFYYFFSYIRKKIMIYIGLIFF